MTASICPFLGRADDRETAFAFSSPGNRCYKMDEPITIALPHQVTYCVSEAYTQCPVFLSTPQEVGEDKTSEFQPVLPIEIDLHSEDNIYQTPRVRNVPTENKLSTYYESYTTQFNRFVKSGPTPNPAVPAIFLTSLAILIIALLFLSVVTISSFASPRPAQTTAAIINTPANVIQPEIFLITLTPTFRSAFATKIGTTNIQTGALLEPLNTSTPMPTPLTIVVTPTIPPAAPGYHACGAPATWVPYIVQAGDSLTILSVIYDVPLNELSSYNCLLNTDNLYIGAEIYVPFVLPAPTSNP